MPSRKSGRFSRVTSDEERIPVGVYVRAPGDVSEPPMIPNTSRGRGQGRGEGRGMGRGRGVVTTPIPTQSDHGSSRSHCGRGRDRGRGRATNMITREELADEIAQQI
uniref:Uncharacterized protein n=1 Tax=Lactuca sativa TaxID=4236 RepID=A0A9R1XV30_LACSA|nr:hypothetical protein LSAT_V11C100047230 [Lactuca sativa]